jgi:hypothetical protein
MPRRLTLSLDAVVVAVTADRPRVLTASTTAGAPPALPSGPLDADGDATLELGLRRWISAQTGLAVGYVEQLYTFGDRDRERFANSTRPLSVAYLALVKEAQPAPGAAWLDAYDLMPWEDRRSGSPAVVTAKLLPALTRWAGRDVARKHRVTANFGDPRGWDPIRVLERYELLRDRGRQPGAGAPGTELAFDHRRIVATALGRLRGKLKYRPVVFELLPETFTLLQLQRTVETLTGMRLHKQNFRRLVENGRILEPTRGLERAARGRPAKLFRFRKAVVRARLY